MNQTPRKTGIKSGPVLLLNPRKPDKQSLPPQKMEFWSRLSPKIPARIFRGLRIPVAGILTFLVLSCPSGEGSGSGGDFSIETVFDTKTFWAERMDTGQHYPVPADLLAEGRYCKIWVERNPKGSVGSAEAWAMAREYDTNIYPKMIGAFDIGQVSYGGQTFDSIMELADWLTDGDGKLSILLLDIQDGYDPLENRSYVGGYFWSGNFYQRNSADWRQYSNLTDMIYVDTYPSKPGAGESGETLAHEMQHLMNFVTSFVVRGRVMDIWINEGLSSAAEYIYLKAHSNNRYEWFRDDPKGTIAKGNNFFVWGNYADDSILDDYATVYLFFQWLRIQAGGTAIYKSIIRSPYPDYQAVTGAMKPHLDLMTGDSDWGGLLKTWLAANYINAPSGSYGYKNEPKLANVKAKTAPAGTVSLQLLPGEGVYSISTGGDISSYVSGSGPNIKYAGVSRAPEPAGLVIDTGIFPIGALLTYNANTSPTGAVEPGKLTGAADVSAVQFGGGSSQTRSVGNTAWEGPVSIDAQDMLARHGQPREGFDQALLPGAKVFAGEAHGE
jgi:hypothetical protein